VRVHSSFKIGVPETGVIKHVELESDESGKSFEPAIDPISPKTKNNLQKKINRGISLCADVP